MDAQTATEMQAAKEMVVRFLEASMAHDRETVAKHIAPDCEITFVGARRYRHADEIAAFNAKRYEWVKKRPERTDAAPAQDAAGAYTVVYSLGALYGAWPDGEPFDNLRYVDRFEIRDGRITRWEIWNDAGERLLQKHGLDV